MTNALSLFALMFVLIGGTCWINAIIVFNTPRYMSVAPSMLWCEKRYVRKLPNILKHLYDAGFASPWPARPTAISALLFRRKLRKVLKHEFPDAGQLVQQHLSTWAFVQLHHADLRQLILKRQIQRIRIILNESLDADLRQHLLAFLAGCKQSQSRVARQCASPATTVDTIDWLSRLRLFDVLLREHGYRVSDEMVTLDRWEDADDETILGELSLVMPQASKPSCLS
jgi:hypothetical protein